MGGGGEDGSNHNHKALPDSSINGLPSSLLLTFDDLKSVYSHASSSVKLYFDTMYTVCGSRALHSIHRTSISLKYV